MRKLKYFQALLEAQEICLEMDENVYLIGLGVPDPKGIFGTTVGLRDKFGRERVLDMPISEAGLTGMAIGSAVTGLRPIMTHQRIDFALPAVEQLINQAAKWHFMFGGQSSVPMVVRMMIGRGWGQGPQHSQSLQSLFAHIPGLKVVMPSTAYDAKGLFIASVEDNNPVIFLEHRWLYGMESFVPEEKYVEPLGKCKVVKDGRDLTIVATSHMTIEALRVAEILASYGYSAEVVDIRTISPIDWETIFTSVSKTGRLLVADTGAMSFGVSGEVIAKCSEELFDRLKSPPARVALPDYPSPTTPPLANNYFPTVLTIAEKALSFFDKKLSDELLATTLPESQDIPDPSFTGPF